MIRKYDWDFFLYSALCCNNIAATLKVAHFLCRESGHSDSKFNTRFEFQIGHPNQSTVDSQFKKDFGSDQNLS